MVSVSDFNAGSNPGGTAKFSDGTCKHSPRMSCPLLKLCVCLLFRFVLSYGIVGKPGAGI